MLRAFCYLRAYLAHVFRYLLRVRRMKNASMVTKKFMEYLDFRNDGLEK